MTRSNHLLTIGLIVTYYSLYSLAVDHENLSESGESDRQDHCCSVPSCNYTSLPVVFMPGDGGTQLEARLNKTSVVHYICHKVSDWYQIWLNLHLLTPYTLDCVIDNMRLTYDPDTKLTYNSPGVEIRVRDFGSLKSVAYLDGMSLLKTDYFENIARTLEKDHQLEREVEMVAAGYDFRKAPNELSDYFADSKLLIEQTYESNNFRKINLVCHSMGCLNTLHLLNGQTQIWRDTFVRRLVAVAAPWSGSFKAITSMLFGNSFGIPALKSYKLQALQSTFPSLTYLFPRGIDFGPDYVIAQTSQRNYTMADVDQFLHDLNLTDQEEYYKITSEIASSLEAPKVELWCLYGSGVRTPSKLKLEDPILPLSQLNHTVEYVDGDGTVSIESSLACERFRADQTQPVHMRAFESHNHIQMVKKLDVAKYISYIVDETRERD